MEEDSTPHQAGAAAAEGDVTPSVVAESVKESVQIKPEEEEQPQEKEEKEVEDREGRAESGTGEVSEEIAKEESKEEEAEAEAEGPENPLESVEDDIVKIREGSQQQTPDQPSSGEEESQLK